MRRWIPLALLAALLGGCSGAGGDQVGGSSSSPDRAVGTNGYAGEAPTDGKAVPDADGTSVTAPQIVQTAQMGIEVKDIRRGIDKVRAVAASSAGRVEDQEASLDASASATLTLKVPAKRFEETLESLKGVGTVVSDQRSANDVTRTVVDVQSRLATMERSVTRIRQLLASASNVAEIVTIEGELTEREAELESLQAQLKTLTGQVEEATITVRLASSGDVLIEKTGFLAGLSSGWKALKDSGVVTLTALGAALPFIGVLVVLAGVLVVVLKLVRRRRRRDAPELGDQTHA